VIVRLPAGEDLPISTVAIVVAAGSGERMGAGTPKALIPLAGRPLLAWSLGALHRSDRVDAVVVAAPPQGLEQARGIVDAACEGAVVTPGGASRSASVRAGLEAAGETPTRVLVHDAARPLVTPELIAAVLDALDGADGAIAASPVADTLKRARDDLAIEATVDRAGLWRAETPQVFHAPVLRSAIAAAERAGTLAASTDCASMVEADGGRVRIVPSTTPNMKVTTPADLLVAEALLGGRGVSGRC
jgi:2-C-methyl-D-erythritol 4-phosphate cytidylyltransferase